VAECNARLPGARLARGLRHDRHGRPDSEPRRDTNAEHREYMFGLWDELQLGDDLVFVVHDWDSVLAFDWANQRRCRVQGVAWSMSICDICAYSCALGYTVPHKFSGRTRLIMQNASVFLQRR